VPAAAKDFSAAAAALTAVALVGNCEPPPAGDEAAGDGWPPVAGAMPSEAQLAKNHEQANRISRLEMEPRRIGNLLDVG
jgi:hypothetical protein